jgi:hypothetical protein
MKPLRRGSQALHLRPWAVAVIAALGTTLLVPSALALLVPPELLDLAVALGDTRLALSLGALFAVSACVARLLLRRQRLPEEDLDDDAFFAKAVTPAGAKRAPATSAAEEDLAKASPAKGYLR